MKELSSLSANFLASLDADRAPIRMVELVLILTEPAYRFDGDELLRERQLFEVRFTARPAALREMAATLLHLADECEACPMDAPQPATTTP